MVTTFLIYFGWGVIAPTLPLFGRELGASEAAVGLLVAAFGVSSFCFDIVGGRVSDRIGARWTAVGGAVLVAAASVLGGLAPNFPVLLLSRLLTGAGSAFYVTTAMNVLARTTETERMGRTMSAYQGAILAGVALGPAAGGLMTQVAGFRPPFIIYGFCSLLCAGVAGRMLPVRLSRPATPLEGGAPFTAVLRDTAFLTALAVAFVVFIVRTGVVSTTVPLFAHEGLGLSQGLVGLALTASAVSNLVWLPSAGRLADRRPRSVSTAIGLVAAIAGLMLLGADSGAPGLYAAMVLMGVSTAFAGVSPAAMITDVTPPAQSGTALGAYRMAVDGSSVLAPLSAGLLAGAVGYRAVFLAFIVPLALVLLAVTRLRDTRRVTAGVGAGRR